VITVLLIFILAQPSHGFTKDIIILSIGAVSGVKGYQLIKKSRKGIESWHRSRDVLRFNRDLDEIAWLRQFQNRRDLKEKADEQFVIGISCLAISATTFWLYYRFKIKSDVRLKKDELFVTFSLKF